MIENTKTCTACRIEKPATLENFYKEKAGRYGLRSTCKDCYKKHYEINIEKIKESAKRNYEKNHERYRAYCRVYYAKNSKEIDKHNIEWARNNPDKRREHRRRWADVNPDKNTECKQKYNRKIRSTPKGKINDRMCTAIGLALRGNKNGSSWEKLVGYTCNDLKKHLERLFTEGMTWENIGEWHIDHITPKSLFNYTKPEHLDFKRCWALSNLQPLWAIDNLKKSNKLTKQFQPNLTV